MTGGALVVQTPAGVVVFHREFTIGSDGSGVKVPDEHASRQHATVYPYRDEWVVEDLGSMNATWVNGERIYGPVVLGKGDKIRVGRTVLIVVPT